MPDNLRSIEFFTAAYEERSFTLAARRENATQSGVSQHIRKLEERLGAKLFFRDRSRVTPTPAGTAYYERCVELLRLLKAADGLASGFGKGVTGQIFIGLMPTMTRSALAPALSRFTEEQPNVAVRIVEAYSAVLTGQVRSGELDFAIVPAIPNFPGIRSRPFKTTIEVLVSRRDSGLRHLAPVRLAEVAPLKLVVPGVQNTRRRTIEIYLAANAVQVQQVLELDAMLGTLDFVSRSDWLTVLPGTMMSSDIEQHSVTVNPIVDPLFRLDLVLIEPTRRVMSEAAEAFLTVLREETERLDEPWSRYLTAQASLPAGREPASAPAG